MRAGGFPGNPGGLIVSILKVAGGRAPAHQARGRGRRTWRPTERSRRCSDGTAGRRQRSAGGWTAKSRRVSEYRRSGGIEPTRPRGGKGAPAGGTGGGKDGQHTEGGSRLHVTTTDSRTGQTSRRDGGGHRLASWTSGYATARSEAICRGAGCGRTRTSGSVGGQGQQRPWSTRPIGVTEVHLLWQKTIGFRRVAPGKTCGAMYGTKAWPTGGKSHAGAAQFACADGSLAARCSWS